MPPQAGNNHPTTIPQGVFETSDGHINIAAAGQTIWKRLCAALDADELASNPDYETVPLRLKNRDTLGAEITKRTKLKSSAYWIEMLAEAGVPCGPIYSIDQVFGDDHVKQLGVTAVVESDAIGPIEIATQAIGINRTPSHIAAAAPERGEHSEEILEQFGYSADEIAAFRSRNVV